MSDDSISGFGYCAAVDALSDVTGEVLTLTDVAGEVLVFSDETVTQQDYEDIECQ